MKYCILKSGHENDTSLAFSQKVHSFFFEKLDQWMVKLMLGPSVISWFWSEKNQKAPAANKFVQPTLYQYQYICERWGRTLP